MTLPDRYMEIKYISIQLQNFTVHSLWSLPDPVLGHILFLGILALVKEITKLSLPILQQRFLFLFLIIWTNFLADSVYCYRDILGFFSVRLILFMPNVCLILLHISFIKSFF